MIYRIRYRQITKILVGVVSMAADTVWEQIKTEYITQGVSPRELAKKYKVSKNTIYQRAKSEDWEGQKVQFRDETGTKIRDSIQNQMVDDAVKLMSAADALLDRVVEIIDLDNPKHMTPSGVKNLAETLLNLKEIKNIRSDEDIEEQRARIAKLHREAEKDDRSASITVTLEREMDSYGA